MFASRRNKSETRKIENLKKLTNFENTKKVLNNIKLELPEVPELKSIKKVMINRDEKIMNEIIKPKDNLINQLHQENMELHKELSKQAIVIEEDEKYQKERDKITADNENLHNTVKLLEHEYKKKSNILDLKFDNRKRELEQEFDIRYEYKNKIKSLEKENHHLHKIIDKFYETVEKFIDWICHKFGIGESKELVKNFQEDKHIFIDPVKQIEYENELLKNFEIEL